MKKIISVLLAAALIFSLCGCTVYSRRADLTVGVLDEIKSFSPGKAAGDAEIITAVNCFEGLMRTDENGSVSPAGATACSVSADGLVYTFKLNPKAKWHLTDAAGAVLEASGIKPSKFNDSVTASDYKESFIRAIGEKSPGYENLLCIKGARAFAETGKSPEKIGIAAQDDHTLIITLEKPCIDFTDALALPVALPESALFRKAAGSIYGTTVSTVICNGTYYPREYSETGTLILEENPDYKGIADTLNSTVTLYLTGKKDSLRSRFDDGTYDVFLSRGADTGIKTKPDCSRCGEVWGLMFNCASEAASDKNLRLALACATDFDSVKLPEFAHAYAEEIIPMSYTLNTCPYSETADGIKQNFDPLLTDIYFNSVNDLPVKLKIRVPAELENTFKKICSLWESEFPGKIETTVSVFDRSEADKIAAEADFDIAVLPVKTDFTTACAALESLTKAPCNCSDPEIAAAISSARSADPRTVNEEIIKAQNAIIGTAAFIPIFDVECSVYSADGISGIYTAPNEKIIYFNAAVKKDSK